MASNHGGKDVMETGMSDGNNSEATVEIKIKTLDSQTYTMRVDKCVNTLLSFLVSSICLVFICHISLFVNT